MKTKLKAFTLVELIVVMAILMLMMAAIMKFFEPIRQVYNDATYYEQRSSVTNSMCKYTTESIRYAKYLGIYSSNEVATITNPKGDAEAAVGRFKASLATDVTPSIIVPHGTAINVIELDYSQFAAGTYNNKTYDGRLFRTKGKWNATTTKYDIDNTHLAFGPAYYAANNYYMQWAYQGGKFEAYASSYNSDDGLNPDGVVVRSVTATVLKNLTTNDPGKVFFTDTNTNGVPDFTEDSLTTTGTNIPYGGMGTKNNYYLVWIDATQMP
jgi:type II secretory pathway pseudopilin PulG